jgi:hypothetical protein
VKATTEGVVRLPSEFSSTEGSPPSITAMQEFVVPKSMPSIFAIKLLICFSVLSFSSHFTISLDTTLRSGMVFFYGVNTLCAVLVAVHCLGAKKG